MNYLLTSDLHFTDNPRDYYKFKLFDWLLQQQTKYDVNATFILGDLTDNKDKHPAGLVNAIVDGLKSLKPPIYIIMGNHDFINPSTPFFYFLDHMDIFFCHRVTPLYDYKICLIPYQPSQSALDEAFARVPDGWVIMCHNTFTGAVNETGSALTGFILPPNNARAIYAGDVHAPQSLSTPNGDVIYLGSPYHVRFGDNFTPRALLLAHGKGTDLHFPSPRKLHCTVRDISELPSLNKGDQIKITMELNRSEVVEWANHKQAILDYCQGLGVNVYGTRLIVPQSRRKPKLDETNSRKSNADYFAAFCSAERIPPMIKKVGSELL